MKITNYTRKTVAIIGGGLSQLPYIRATKECGLRTIVFDKNPECQFNNSIDIFFQISTHDIDGILNALKTFRDDLLSCFTYSSYHPAQKAAALVNDYFGLIGLKSQPLKFASEKSIFRAKMSDINFSTPRSILITDLIQAKNSLTDFEQAIVKPANGSCGSAGISLVKNKDSDLLQKLQIASDISVDGSILIEEFIAGVEYSVDGFVDSAGVNIIMISKKITLGSEYGFAIDGFYFDPQIFADFKEQFLDKIETAVLSTGLSESFFSFDVILANNKIYFIDFGCLLDAKIDVLMEYAGASIYAVPAAIALGTSMNLDFRKAHELPISSRLIYLKSNDVSCDWYRSMPHQCKQNFVGFGDFNSVRKPPQSVADSVGIIISVGDQAKLAWSTPWAFDLVGGYFS